MRGAARGVDLANAVLLLPPAEAGDSKESATRCARSLPTLWSSPRSSITWVCPASCRRSGRRGRRPAASPCSGREGRSRGTEGRGASRYAEPGHRSALRGLRVARPGFGSGQAGSGGPQLAWGRGARGSGLLAQLPGLTPYAPYTPEYSHRRSLAARTRRGGGRAPFAGDGSPREAPRPRLDPQPGRERTSRRSSPVPIEVSLAGTGPSHDSAVGSGRRVSVVFRTAMNGSLMQYGREARCPAAAGWPRRRAPRHVGSRLPHRGRGGVRLQRRDGEEAK